MRELNIVMVVACPFPANHGTPANIKEMSEYLAELGHHIHIVTYPFGHNIKVKEALKIHRISRISRVNKVSIGPAWYRPLYDLLMVLKLSKIVRKYNIDIIHAHNYEGAIIGYIVKKISGKPMVYHAVNSMLDELPTYPSMRPKWLIKIIANFLDNNIPKRGNIIIAMSEGLKSYLISTGISPNKIEVIPAGVNPEMFDGYDPENFKKRLSISGKSILLYTGTLDNFQRIDLLLKAFSVVIKEYKNVLLVIAANIVVQKQLEMYREMARSLKIERNVLFIEEYPLSDLPSILASADICVLPRSECPGFPIKLLNYMSASKAIVAFEGAAHSIVNNYNGITVKNYDYTAMGKAITKLLSNKAEREKLGQNARRSLYGNFDWNSISKRISKAYSKVI